METKDKYSIQKMMDEYGYESLSPEIDEAFIEFYTSSWSDDFNLDPICNLHLKFLEMVAHEFLREYSDTETTRKYFKNLRLVWSYYFNQGRFKDAELYLERILHPIHIFEQHQGKLLHKGPIYYFLGGTALVLGELDKGFLLMHKAYDEEIRIQEAQPTPSLKFVSLNFSDNRQYFGFLVRMYAKYLDRFFTAYRLVKVTHYCIDDFRQGFLEANPSSDIVFSFTHTLARLLQLSTFSLPTLNSDFAGQYKLNLLFDLALVIENALRVQHPDFGSRKLLFPELLEELVSSLSWNLTRGHLTGSVNQEAEIDYDQCLLDLLDRQFHFHHQISNLDLENDLCIAYLIRNRGAHDVSSSRVIVLRFEHILQSLFNILFLTAENKYL